MSRRTERHTEFLSADDIIDVRRDLDGKDMTGFSLNLRSFIDGRWVELARFATDHGRLHLHRHGTVGARELEGGPPPEDRTLQYEKCRRRIGRHWRAGRALAEARP
jgi:hypothetical protein